MTKENHPLVSIVIPVYNGSNYLREAIDSALAQTYDNVEILVINDGSTDNGATHDIAMSYGKKIRYFQKENGGVVSALNFGIDNMRGEYFSWLSHDDLYLPEKIEKQVLALKNHKSSKPAFSVCNSVFIDETGKEVHISHVQQDCEFDNPPCFLFLGNIGFTGIMVLIPRVLFDICGKFTPSLATHEYDMWLRIMAVADVVVEPGNLAVMRMHSEQVSRIRKRDVEAESDLYIGSVIQNLQPKEFESYIIGRIKKEGVKYIFDLLNGYMMCQEFLFTSEQILKQLRLMCMKKSEYVDEIFSFLLGTSNIDQIKSYCKNSLNSEKKYAVVYCDGLTDDLLKQMVVGLGLIESECELVLLYLNAEAHHLQFLKSVNVTPIKIAFNQEQGIPIPQWFLALRLAVLCNMLNAKFFWYYSVDNIMPYAQAFHYLNMMNIHSIASFCDINAFVANEYDLLNICGIEQKKNVLKASLITNQVAPSALIQLYYKNIIQASSYDLQSLSNWKKIFDVFLSTDDYCELKSKIDEGLSSFMTKDYESSSDYIQNYIRSFLYEVDRKSFELINAYEQRSFWKLTKPIRHCVWTIRKVRGAISHIFKHKVSIGSKLYRIRLIFRNRRSLG